MNCYCRRKVPCERKRVRYLARVLLRVRVRVRSLGKWGLMVTCMMSSCIAGVLINVTLELG